jgi:hypothetical protein
MADAASHLSCIPRAFAALAALTDDELAAELGVDVLTVRTYRNTPDAMSIEDRKRLVRVLLQHGIRGLAVELEFETDAAAWFAQRLHEAIASGLSRKAAIERVWREVAAQEGESKALTGKLTLAGLAPDRQS